MVERESIVMVLAYGLAKTDSNTETLQMGSALSCYGTITMKEALVDYVPILPEQLGKSLTYDRVQNYARMPI